MGALAPCLGRLLQELQPLILVAVQPLLRDGQINGGDPVGDPVVGIGGKEERHTHLADDGGSGCGGDHGLIRLGLPKCTG